MTHMQCSHFLSVFHLQPSLYLQPLSS